jgi:hypothetical protein
MADRATENGWSEGAQVNERGSRLGVSAVPPNPEVPSKAARRRFTAEYKLRILKQADACTELGKLGELLRGRVCMHRISRHGVAKETKVSCLLLSPRSGAGRRQSAIRSLKRMRSWAGTTSD